jgi:branched-chain amino acid transport system ATP-binding protein
MKITSVQDMLLEADHISKSFGGVSALKDVSVHVQDAEIVGLIGPNGAGKTTFFNIISGFTEPDKGHLTFNGEDIAGIPPHVMCRKGIARTFQLVKPFRRATLFENVLVGAKFGQRLSELSEARKEAIAALDTVGLHGKKDVLANDLTLPELKRLEVARALSTGPRMVLLDEMTAGLDSAEVRSILDLIRKIRERNVSIIIVEHVMGVVMSIADRLVVLDHGEKIAEGNPTEVVQNEKVVSAYLGEGYVESV